MKRSASSLTAPSKKQAKAKSWEYPASSGIIIAEIANRTGGEAFGVSYQVRIPAKLAGNREQHQRKTKIEAETLAEDRFIALKQHGRLFAALPPAAQEEAALAWSKYLQKSGVGFLEAAATAVRVLRPEGGPKTVAEVIAELKESKEARYKRGELRERSWLDYDSRSKKAVAEFGHRPINLVTGDDLAGWLKRMQTAGVGDGPLGNRSVKNYRNYLSELFTYAAQKRYCSENPLLRFTREELAKLGGNKNKRAKINVLSVAQAEALVRTAQAHPEVGMLPSIVLRLFCGLRTEEVVRLDWHDVRWQEPEPYVTISEEQAKGRAARNVTIPPNALEWLALCPKKTGPVSPVNDSPGHCKKFRRIQKLAGFGTVDEKTGKWRSGRESNDTRHSYGSYHFALHGNSILTATEMGHKQGDTVLFNNYRKLTTKAEGRLYFGIRPEVTTGSIEEFPMASEVG